MEHPDIAYESRQYKRQKLAGEIAMKTGVSHDTAQNVIGVFGEHYIYMPHSEITRKEFIDSLVSKEMIKFYPIKEGTIKEQVQENADKIGQELFLAGYLQFKDWENVPKIVLKKDFETRIKELI